MNSANIRYSGLYFTEWQIDAENMNLKISRNIEGNKTIHFYRNEFSRNEFYLVGLVKCRLVSLVFSSSQSVF